MKNFNNFYKNLTKNPSRHTEISIQGTRKKIKAMILLTSINYLIGRYMKILFDDGSYLLIIIQDEELYYSDTLLNQAEGITDGMIGKKTINFRGKKYKLGNKNDYQFVLRLYVGSPIEIDSECRFSDYFPVEGEKEFLSLGWLSHTGKRADIHCKIISLDDVEIL